MAEAKRELDGAKDSFDKVAAVLGLGLVGDVRGDEPAQLGQSGNASPPPLVHPSSQEGVAGGLSLGGTHQ
eukprot:11411019-Prorocentrum_lima.AAC.1